MARKPKDTIPSFYVETPETNVTTRDFDIFYKPQQVPTNPAIQELTIALSEFVPTLSNYSSLGEYKDKEINIAKAEADLQSNKMNFKKLVDNKEIPEGKNPHYFNKMMELELKNKARQFALEFDEYYASNDIAGRLNINAFNDVYEQKMKEFYNKNNLDKFDPLALNNAFFSNTSDYRQRREQEHENNRFQFIKDRTETLSVTNYANSFIDFSATNAPISEVINFIKNEVDSYIASGTSPNRANQLFEKGLLTYIDVIDDGQGIDYARNLINNLDALNLSGFGIYTSTKSGSILQKQLKDTLTNKELFIFDRDNETFKQKVTNDKIEITKIFLDDVSKGTFVNINDLAKKNNFNDKQLAYLREIYSAYTDSITVKTSDPDAIIELTNMRDKPFDVADKASEMLRDNRITLADYERFYSKGLDYNILENDIVFTQSRTYQNFKRMFNDQVLASVEGLTYELPFIKTDIEDELLEYYFEQKKLGLDSKTISRRIDQEVKVIFFQKIQDGRFGQAESFITDIANKYNLRAFLKPKTEQNKE